MNRAKYIIADGSAIVFSAAITHSDMVRGKGRIDGAGFVTFAMVNVDGEDIIKANAYGDSVSLGIKSRGEDDSIIITRQISNVW
jgi:hypothetical protein